MPSAASRPSTTQGCSLSAAMASSAPTTAPTIIIQMSTMTGSHQSRGNNISTQILESFAQVWIGVKQSFTPIHTQFIHRPTRRLINITSHFNLINSMHLIFSLEPLVSVAASSPISPHNQHSLMLRPRNIMPLRCCRDVPTPPQCIHPPAGASSEPATMQSTLLTINDPAATNQYLWEREGREMSARGIATKTPPPQDPQPPTAYHVNHTREAIAATMDIRGLLDRPAAREQRTSPAPPPMFLDPNRLPELIALTEAFHAFGSLTYLLTLIGDGITS